MLRFRRKNAYSEMRLIVAAPDGRRKELVYDIRPSAAAQLWARCIEQARVHGLRERRRFNGFPGNPSSDLEHLIGELLSVIANLKAFHPEIEFIPLDRSRLSESVNALHFHFAHSHHVTKAVNAENEQAWTDFNVLLHAIEMALKDKDIRQRTGLPGASITVTWNKPIHTPIPEDSYPDFSLGSDFGTAYINYHHVGRHFLEMFFANDDILADEHIQPARLLGGDTRLWFGPSTGHYVDKILMERMESWFKERAERFNRLGHFWGDPKTALGYIPVARLRDQIHRPDEILQFLKDLAPFSEVIDMTVK